MNKQASKRGVRQLDAALLNLRASKTRQIKCQLAAGYWLEQSVPRRVPIDRTENAAECKQLTARLMEAEIAS